VYFGKRRFIVTKTEALQELVNKYAPEHHKKILGRWLRRGGEEDLIEYIFARISRARKGGVITQAMAEADIASLGLTPEKEQELRRAFNAR
jgi:hypothetical protein